MLSSKDKPEAGSGEQSMPQPPHATTQKGRRAGLESEMEEKPIPDKLEQKSEDPGLEGYTPAGKLEGRKALVTGGDSGIGRAVALFYALEGSDVAIAYLPEEQKDAEDTRKMITSRTSRQCHLIPCDLVKGEKECKRVIDEAVNKMGGLDILVNNASQQKIVEKIEDLKEEDVESTFKVNIMAMIYLAKHAVPHFDKGSSIINTTSVTTFKGSPTLIDYSSTKGAIVGFTRSLAIQLAETKIRVNAVAPGPIWTPLQPVSREQENLDKWVEGGVGPLGRIGQPSEVATAYVFLASQDASFYTGQTLHPNGGDFTA